MKERITLDDTFITAAMKLSGGNPGALNVVMSLYQEGCNIDPDDLFGSFGPLLSLDSHGIYESEIWMLYKDVCDQDLTKVVLLLRACQLGALSERDLKKAITGGDRGYGNADLLPKTFPEYLTEVRQICTQFAPGVQY